MGRISQDAAHSASVKIVAPIQKKIEEVNKEIKEFLTVVYLETVPPEVMKLWKKHSAWMYHFSTVYPKGVGIASSSSQSIESSPNNSGGYYKDLHLSKEQAAIYVKLIDKRDELKEKYKNTQKEIEVAILSLGTHKKVADQFPEVAGFFIEGVKENTQLIVQLAPVREKVKCLVSEDQEKKCIDKL